MRSVRRSPLRRALAWLFAVACLTALVATAPRASALGPELRANTATIAPVPAREAGKALVRDAHSLRIVAPAPEPLAPVAPLHVSASLERSARDFFDDVHLAPHGIAVRVVRWRSHVPRMDSGEPPRSDAFAS